MTPPRPPYTPNPSPSPEARPPRGATEEERRRIDEAHDAALEAKAIARAFDARVSIVEADIRKIQDDARDEARRVLADSRASLATVTGAHQAVVVAAANEERASRAAAKGRRWELAKAVVVPALAITVGAIGHNLADWLRRLWKALTP